MSDFKLPQDFKKTSNSKRPITYLTDADRKRRKRELVIIAIIIGVIVLLTFAENRLINFGQNFPISNTILMFILINLNLLLLILLIFLVFRNLVKLLYDRKRRVMGSKLRTRLVVAFISLTLVPTSVLFLFSVNFITSSIEFWFNAPVEQALENSLVVGRQLYQYIETNHLFFLERVAYQIKIKKLLEHQQQDALSQYVRVVQKEFNLDAVEIYAANSQQIAIAISPEIAYTPLQIVNVRDLTGDEKPMKTISEMSPHGELRRTIGAVPFGESLKLADAFVVLTTRIPQDLSTSMGFISQGFEEYQQIKLLKRPVQVTYYITISIVALLVLFCAIWFGFYLAKSISIPIMELADGTRRVAEGDLQVNIPPVADDEIGSLVESFNKMTHDLRVSREQLEFSAQKLRQQNIEIEERRRFMEIVLNNVSTGVVSLNASGFIATCNKSAERMLNIRSEDIIGKNYQQLLDVHSLEQTRQILDQLLFSSSDAVELPLRMTIDRTPRSFFVHASLLKDDEANDIGLVIVFDDLTEQEKAQRMAAWREVARRIAHEVKNPLTPISLSAQRLKRKYSRTIDDPVFSECTQMIIDHVELIRNLVNEFSQFARFPSANPKPCQLGAIIEESVALFREGHERVKFEVRIPENIGLLNLDRQQIKQAMINLIDNAIAAMKAQGTISISVCPDPKAKLVRLEIADTGDGIPDDEKSRLFEPYFSTKKSGMGLGLTIVNTIIAEHRGTVRVQDNHPNGAKFIIELPK